MAVWVVKILMNLWNYSTAANGEYSIIMLFIIVLLNLFINIHHLYSFWLSIHSFLLILCAIVLTSVENRREIALFLTILFILLTCIHLYSSLVFILTYYSFISCIVHANVLTCVENPSEIVQILTFYSSLLTLFITVSYSLMLLFIKNTRDYLILQYTTEKYYYYPKNPSKGMKIMKMTIIHHFTHSFTYRNYSSRTK